jgi:hypothetical protein
MKLATAAPIDPNAGISIQNHQLLPIVNAKAIATAKKAKPENNFATARS